MTFIPVAGKITSQGINNGLSALDSKIESVDGGPFGAYTNVIELNSQYPNGRNGFAVIDGYSYWWKNNEWVQGDVYQAVGIPNRSVTDDKLADNYLNSNVRKSKNLFNKNTATEGYYISHLTGNLVPFEPASYSEYIEIDPSLLNVIASGINSNYAGGGAFYDSTKTYISGFGTSALRAGLVIPSNAQFIRISVPIVDLPTAQLEYGTVASNYEEFGKNYLKEKSINLNDISNEVVDYFKTQNKKLQGKKILTIGDSITWLDGKTVSNYNDGNTVVIGYQEQFRLHGAIVTNKGNSGATIAQYDETDTGTHGSLYDDIVTNNYDVSGFDIVTILAGTNDVMYKQGIYGNVGNYEDTTFDTTTTLGALRGLIEYLLTSNPKVEIYLFAPFFSNDLSRTRVRMLDINDKMNQVSELYNLPCAKTYTELGINKFNFTQYFYDNTHPKNEGMEKLGEFMVRHMI